MKKKLADFFQELLDQRHTVLVDYYEPYALIMSEDGNVVTGLLVGLNSFDYNVYIKDEFFDLCEPVVDLKYYLRETIQDSGIGTDTCDGDPDIARSVRFTFFPFNIYYKLSTVTKKLMCNFCLIKINTSNKSINV